MTALYARAERAERVRATLTNPDRIAAALDGTAVPDTIVDWLGRLHTLLGVPFGYLVPSEEMLPPESIRFFRLDEAWVEALIDGAFSLGRDQTADAGTNHTAAIDAVVLGSITSLARAAAPVHRMPAHLRAAHLRAGGLEGAGRRVLSLPVPADPATRSSAGPHPSTGQGASTWNGFLLRSAVVGAYPGLGVNAYPPGHTPDDPDPTPLEVKRLDRLGPNTDTLFCLVVGDVYRVDVHEAPELLHYGLDTYTAPAGGGAPVATKHVHAFDRAPDGTITFRTEDGQPVILDVDLSKSLRPPPHGTSTPSRVIDLAAAATAIGAANDPADPTALDSAQLGFAMTAGVGMVSFLRRPTPPPGSTQVRT